VVGGERGVADEVRWRSSVQSSVGPAKFGSAPGDTATKCFTLILTQERLIEFIPIIPVQNTAFNEDIIQEYKVEAER